MSSSNLDQTSTLCGACRFLTEAEEIITCSSCRMTYHSRCVDNTAADTEWYCPEGCRNNPDDSAEQAREQPEATEMNCPAVGQAEEFDAERWIREKQEEIEMELAERQAQIDRELREKEEKMAEAIRQVMRRQEANLELERKKKADHERRMADLQSSFQRRSSLINEQLELTKYGFEKMLQCPQIVDLTSEEEAEDEKKIECEESSNEESSSETSEDSDGSSKSSAKNTDESGAKLKKGFVSRSPNGLGQQCSGLEKPRLAAGGGLTRQPPCYPNDPEVWPKSFGTREGSSKAYGVTDERNLAGLRDWLKGAARNTGWSLVDFLELLPLSHPESARELEHPEADKRVKIISIESAGEQLCEHMEATDLTLLNPFAKKDPGSVPPDGGERHWATRKTEANIPSQIKPVKMAGESRRRQQEKPLLYCQKEDSTSPDRANEKQQVACHDHQLRFCAEIAKLSVDERIKIIARWEPGGDVLFNQSDADIESHILVALPVASAVLIGNFSSANALVFGLAPNKRYQRRSPTSDAATAVAQIARWPAARSGLGTVQGILAVQQTAEAHRAWQRSTLLNGLAFAVSASCGNISVANQKPTTDQQADELSPRYGNGVEADDERLKERFGDLRWTQPAGIAASGQHQATVKDPDKPNDHSQLQDSMASAQQGPADTDRVEFRRQAEHNMWRQAQVDDFPEEQNLHQSGSELRDDRRDHQCAGHDKGGGTPLRRPDIGLLATKSCKLRDNDGHENATHGVANPRCLVVSSTVNAHKQMDPERVLGSTAKVGVGNGGDAGSAFAVDITAVKENLLGPGARKLTEGNRRTTTASVLERFVVDINNNQRSVHEKSHQTKEANQSEQKSSVNTAVLEDLGKSYEPDGPTDVTGWGVTTAEMATLPSGATPAV